MFTVFAIILTVVGGFLFVRNDYGWKFNTGGYCLVIAAVLWVVVFIALVWAVFGWLWENAP